MARKRLRASLTSKDRERFEFLFERLRAMNPDECPDVGTTLERVKARGVPLGVLGERLFVQYVLDARGRMVLRDFLAAVADHLDRMDGFQKALGRLRRTPLWHLLDAPSFGVRPPVLLELLAAISRVCNEASDTLPRLHQVLSERILSTKAPGKKLTKPHRELIPLPPGVRRDEARDLRGAVLLAAEDAPFGTPTIRYGFKLPDGTELLPCPQCGNPAPLLFKLTGRTK